MNIIQRALEGKFTLIGEIGVNYYDIAKENGITPMKACELMIDKAAEAGMHAVKFQTYKANKIAAKQSPSYWDTSEEKTTSQFELFSKYDSFDFEDYRMLKEYCDKKNIEFLSTAFDNDSADYLNELMDIYKISSSDLSNIPFIEYQAQKNKPIILSSGASTEEEIEKAIHTIRKFNNEPIILMHCVLEYPTLNRNANLNKITTLVDKYRNDNSIIIGYSDHTKPDENYDILATAYNLGATVIEKHYTLNKQLPGNDHYHAMDDQDVKGIMDKMNFIDEIRGNGELVVLESENTSRLNARRSVVTLKNLNKGHIIKQEDITYKRPGTGIPASEFNNIIGLKTVQDITEDTILQYEMLEKN